MSTSLRFQVNFILTSFSSQTVSFSVHISANHFFSKLFWEASEWSFSSWLGFYLQPRYELLCGLFFKKHLRVKKESSYWNHRITQVHKSTSKYRWDLWTTTCILLNSTKVLFPPSPALHRKKSVLSTKWTPNHSKCFPSALSTVRFQYPMENQNVRPFEGRGRTQVKSHGVSWEMTMKYCVCNLPTTFFVIGNRTC